MAKRERAGRPHFLGQNYGSISLEFVILAPLLILLFFSCFAMFEAFRTFNQIAKVAYTMSDVSARYLAVDDDDMEDLFELHKRMLPARVNDGWVRMSSVCFNGDSHRVLWSYVGDDTLPLVDTSVDPLAATIGDGDGDGGGDDGSTGVDTPEEPRLVLLTDDEVPTSIMPVMSDNDSVILTEVFAAWTPVSPVGELSPFTVTHRLVNRPRFVRLIPYDINDIEGYPDAEATLCPEDAPPPISPPTGGT